MINSAYINDTLYKLENMEITNENLTNEQFFEKYNIYKGNIPSIPSNDISQYIGAYVNGEFYKLENMAITNENVFEKNNIYKGTEIAEESRFDADGKISFIPSSNISQYKGEFAIAERCSNCTYNAGGAIDILNENHLLVLHNWNNIESKIFLPMWQAILESGKRAFVSAGKTIKDPSEWDYDDNQLEDTWGVFSGTLGISKDDLIKELNISRYAMFNLAGETVLVYQIAPRRFCLIDSHKTDGFYKIDLNAWVDAMDSFYTGMDATIPTVNFSKKKIKKVRGSANVTPLNELYIYDTDDES
jgi:hypothetical protein